MKQKMIITIASIILLTIGVGCSSTSANTQKEHELVTQDEIQPANNSILKKVIDNEQGNVIYTCISSSGVSIAVVPLKK